jgi:hypothetical protein
VDAIRVVALAHPAALKSLDVAHVQLQLATAAVA